MTLEDLYNHYKCRWSHVAIGLKVTESTIKYWRKKGYIPYTAQLVIQEKTDGLFKADIKHGNPKKLELLQ